MTRDAPLLLLLRREPEGAVEADDLAVEIVVLADVLDQGRVLGGPAHPLGVRHLRAPVGLQLVACLAIGRGQDRARGDRDDTDADGGQVAGGDEGHAHHAALGGASASPRCAPEAAWDRPRSSRSPRRSQSFWPNEPGSTGWHLLTRSRREAKEGFLSVADHESAVLGEDIPEIGHTPSVMDTLSIGECDSRLGPGESPGTEVPDLLGAEGMSALIVGSLAGLRDE